MGKLTDFVSSFKSFQRFANMILINIVNIN